MFKWERHLQITLAIANTTNSNTNSNDGDQLQHQWQLHLMNIVEVSFKSIYEDLRTFRASNSKPKIKQKKVNVYLSSLMMKVPDHVYVFG
jgi:hypothetical protein